MLPRLSTVTLRCCQLGHGLVRVFPVEEDNNNQGELLRYRGQLAFTVVKPFSSLRLSPGEAPIVPDWPSVVPVANSGITVCNDVAPVLTGF